MSADHFIPDSTNNKTSNHTRLAKLSPDLSIQEEREARIFLRQLSIVVSHNRKSASDAFLIVSSRSHEDALKHAEENPGWKVIGIECLRHCVKNNVDLPQRKDPVLTCQLHKKFVCFSGLSSETKQRLSRLAECMGGTVCSGLSMDVTHLIATNLDSAKCQFVVQQARAGETLVRIVEPLWLEDCWALRDEISLPSELPYLVADNIFSGARMSCTGFDIVVRGDMSRLAKRFGANFLNDLDSKCHYLIANAPTGNKYEFARQRGIAVVSWDWLVESCLRYTCLPCSNFGFENEGSSSSSLNLGSAHSTPGDTSCEKSRRRGISSQNAAEPPHPREPQGKAAHRDQVAAETGDGHDSEEQSFFEGMKFYFPADLSASDRRELGLLCR